MEIQDEDNPKKYENEEWAHPSEVRKQYGPFTKYKIQETEEKFINGKPKFKCVFSATDGFIYASHDAAECINKKTKEEFYSVRILSMNKYKKKMREMEAEQTRIRAEILAEELEMQKESKTEPMILKFSLEEDENDGYE